ncbi:hypothetical protein F0562_021938 [Nyssa sinensis]|uniref:DUF3741 domain-containing protein n=1 Tax=Nyssa sinensis TaxID=561372 RepID=A0A5J5BL75_9ASTE|nr:hypothetical protein F0562_021938 [Nyssa sinensis]
MDGRHAKRNGSRKTRLDIHDSGEEQNAETSHFLVDQGTTKTSSTNKRSLKGRMKSLISEEMSKEEDHKQWGRMKATDKLVACNKNFDVYGTKNVEYLEHNQLSENHTFFPEKCNKASETLVDQKLMETKQFSGNASHGRFKEYKDILKLLKVNKELFFKILQNADDGIVDCFHSMHTSNTRTRLTKSGSFPVADLSRSRNFWPSKLKQKQNEMWSFRKGEKLLAGILAPVLVASTFPKDLYTKSGPLMANDSGGSVLNQETSCSSLGSTQALDKNGSSEIVIDLLKDIKQRTENVVEGGENDNNLPSLDALLSRVPSGCRPSTGGKEMVERWNENRIGTESKDCSSSCHETDGPVCDLSKETLTHIRRTSYPNESTDKYARLFDYSFSRDAKWPHSKSLKLTNEYEIQSGGHAPISFRRIHSLPHFDYYCSLQNEVSRDAHLAGMPLPVMTVVDNCTNVESDCHDEPKPVSLPASTEKYVSLDVNEETKCISSMVDVTDVSTRIEYSASLTVGINDKETTKIDGLSEGIDESNSQTTPAEFPISEGLECRCNYLYEKESSVNSQNRSNRDSLTCSSCSTVNAENYENVNNSVKNHSHIELYTRDDADFNYVREILERLGFIKNSFLRTWDLTDQLFEEVEGLLAP